MSLMVLYPWLRSCLPPNTCRYHLWLLSALRANTALLCSSFRFPDFICISYLCGAAMTLYAISLLDDNRAEVRGLGVPLTMFSGCFQVAYWVVFRRVSLNFVASETCIDRIACVPSCCLLEDKVACLFEMNDHFLRLSLTLVYNHVTLHAFPIVIIPLRTRRT